MPYDAPLLAGRLVDRRDRFIAEVSLDDAKDEETVLAHCINPGRMEAFVEIGSGYCPRRVPSASSGSRGRRSRRWA